ncbi:MAG TPA: patatin-like phospholipase family protein [Alphaproteobacteria bacterium]|nr:patatin-like phospholipase family protein [Alphaproteobacteria bacterium]
MLQEGASQDTVRILAIDGGGIRGIIPARVLQEIERRTGKPANQLFDLISGTSTGGIICCGLLKGMSAKSLGDLYAQRGSEIFARSMWQRITNPQQLTGPKYQAAALDEILAETVGETWLGETTGPELLVPTYVIELPKPADSDGYDMVTTRMPYFFKSWKARGSALSAGDVREELDFQLKSIARATSAAPTYFPPAQISNRKGQTFGAVDGGVFANNPAMCALISAYKIFPEAKRYIVVSLGTGSLERDIPYSEAKDWGELQWLHPILSILMDGSADTICYECDELLGDDHFRFEITLGRDPNDPTAVNEDFDDASVDNIRRLEARAQLLIKDAAPKLDKLSKLLVPAAGAPTI